MVLGILWWQNVYWHAVRFWLFDLFVQQLLTADSLAMAEMTTLVAALYRTYTTTTREGFDKISPGITGRYEVFYDESCSGVRVRIVSSTVQGFL